MASFIPVPTAPSGVRAAWQSDAQAEITWVRHPSSGGAYDGQKFGQWNNANGQWTNDDIGGNVELRHTAMSPNSRYQWRVKAVNNKSGGSDWAYSNPIQTTPGAPGVTGVNQTGSGSLTVTWANGASGNGYEYYTEIWASLNGGGYGLAANIGAGATSYTFNNLALGQVWQFAVRHVSNVGVTLTSSFSYSNSFALHASQPGPSLWFPNGRITVRQAPILRSMAHSYIVPNFRGYRTPGVKPDGNWPSAQGTDKNQALNPLNFGSSRIRLVVIEPVHPLFTGPQFSWFPNGRVLLGGLDFGATGALSDFAYWDTTSIDPATLLMESATAGYSGGVGNNWTRHHATVVPPDKARYMAIGGVFNAQSYLLSQSLYAAQAEVLPVGVIAPTTYSEPRQIRVILRPERLNWSENPSFINNVVDWSNLTRTAVAAAPSGFAGRTAVVSGTNRMVEHTVSGLAVDRTYLVKVRVSASPSTVILPTVGGGSVGVTGMDQDVPVDGVTDLVLWIRPDDTEDTVLSFLIKPTANGNVDFHSILIEDTTDPGAEFFDGNTPGGYFWESGQTDGSSRSYYYKNFLARYKTVKSILEADSPMGVGVADPLFAVAPGNQPVVLPPLPPLPPTDED